MSSRQNRLLWNPHGCEDRVFDFNWQEYLLAAFLSAVPASLAWWGYSVGNDMFLYLCSGIALAPWTAVLAMKLKWV